MVGYQPASWEAVTDGGGGEPGGGWEGAQAGVELAFASDWPVVPSGPLEGIHVAVHRAAVGGEATPHAPSESLDAESGLWASTGAAARLGGLQEDLGTLR